MKLDAKSILKPTFVLFVICVVVSAALAGTNLLTENRIKELEAQNAEASRLIVLPAAEAFEPQDDGAFAKGCKAFWDGIVALIRRGNRNHFVMTDKGGRQTLSLPVTLFVVLLVAAFWVVVPLLVVALFFGCRFSFAGPELGRADINSAMGKATDFAEDIKKEFQE